MVIFREKKRQAGRRELRVSVVDLNVGFFIVVNLFGISPKGFTKVLIYESETGLQKKAELMWININSAEIIISYSSYGSWETEIRKIYLADLQIKRATG